MKTIATVCALLVVSAWSCLAQDAKGGGQALMGAQITTKQKQQPQQPKVPIIPPKPTHHILGVPVTYGGYFSDLAKAEDKRALFNLKTPLDPQKDLENVSFYPNSEQARGIVFFSIKF